MEPDPITLAQPPLSMETASEGASAELLLVNWGVNYGA